MVIYIGKVFWQNWRQQWHAVEQRALKIVNNNLNTNIYSYLETSGGQSYNIYLNLVHSVNTSVN